uniref:hypothetical protein n=1 Tax=Pedobacter schmidteae TaxID=2201271 RepID=UPI000EAC18A8|nr:hypothetical protein [Pedobacter schmidteae]
MKKILIFLISLNLFTSCKKSSTNDDKSNKSQNCSLTAWYEQGENSYKFQYNANSQLTEITWVNHVCSFGYYTNRVVYDDKGSLHEWKLNGSNVIEYQGGNITYTNGYITKIDDGYYQSQFDWNNGNLASITTMRIGDNSKYVYQLEYYTDKANIIGFDWGIEKALDIMDDNNPPVTPTLLFGKYSKNLLKSVKYLNNDYANLSYDYENGLPIRITEVYRNYNNTTSTNTINLQYNCK